MPFYQVITKENTLEPTEKSALAKGITDIHCRLTGAPRHFVHVVFSYFNPEDAFTAGEQSPFTFVRAAHRAGRNVELKRELLTQVADMWQVVLPSSRREDLMITITETGPGNVMEGGVILPEPKDDERFKQRTGLQ